MSLPEVSIVTAVHNPNPHYLLEAYESLNKQSIDIQWVIQVDGEADDILAIPKDIRKDARVDISANGERLGVAATRMLALVRASNDLIQNLDADDTFYPEAIVKLADAINHEGVAFAFGQSHLTYPDGHQERWQPSPWPEGKIAPGLIAEEWLSTGQHHVSLSATMWKAVYIHAYGGWGALRTMQDIHMMLPISTDYAAAYLDSPVTRYRVHDEQATRQMHVQGERQLQHRMLIATRLYAKQLLEVGGVDPRPTFFDPQSKQNVNLPIQPIMQ